MADLLDSLARHLQAAGLLTYDPAGTSGDTFVETLPQLPDRAVQLTLYGAGEPDPLNGWDERSLQVRVRGTADPRISRARAEAIFSALHGLAGVELPGGLWLVLCVAQQTPYPLGVDSAGRHEHVLNLRLDVEAATNRPT
ncbi:minor capsid protein [Kitasatospora sp. NBC_00070]|uniref:minor capsid protein n=1 Tax=Kitasatospora sp. NBC_00070 TaxID=2975962 RepID=UPI003247BCEC